VKSLLRGHVVRAAAVAVVAVAAIYTRLPTYSDAQLRSMASHFAFRRAELATAATSRPKLVREVEPQLDDIRSWISAVGAAVSLADLDGDGLPNDVCLVDPRTDSVTVAPAPGTGRRYTPFVLDARPLPYDRATTAPMGCLPGDFDEDGRLDLLVYYWGRTPVMFLRRAGARLGPDGFVRRELVPGGGRWYTDAITQADVDGDGHLDLVVGNYFPDGARVLDARARRDPAMQMQDSMSRATNGGVDRILLWSAPGRFREALGAMLRKVARGWTLAVGAADLDGDLRPELYFANDFGPDRLLYNESSPGRVHFVQLTGRRTFTTPASKVLGHDSFKGMGIDFADLNANGRLDMFVSNITSQFALEESNFTWVSTGRLGEMKHGRAPFVDRSEPLGLSRGGWGWDAKFGDFDNSGELEIVQATGFLQGKVDRWPELQELAMANDTLLHHASVWPRFKPGDDLSGHEPNRFWVRGPAGRFADLSRRVGLGDPFVGRGVATGDVDGDGGLDFAIANQWEPSYLYRNRSPDRGAFLELDLLLPPTGVHGATRVLDQAPRGLRARPAIGAEALLRRPDGRHVLAEVDAGNGHASARAPQLHFGLGTGRVGRVPVALAWRDGDGFVHRQRLVLRPGLHTVLLAQR
jgi:enediyne biosynthesis protein E4